MSGFGVKEARINRERKPRVNLCGSCGETVDQNELLCDDCKAPTVGPSESETDYETRLRG